MDGRLIIGNERFETREKITSTNPATLEPVGEASLASAEESEKAILAAKEAFPLWQSLPSKEKKEIFKSAKRILLQRSSEVANIITLEKGSPYTESLSVEVLGSLEALDFYASALKKSQRSKKARHYVAFFSSKKSSFRSQPLGITFVISPWNFPFLIPFYDILSAITAGNTVIFRPSTSTPLVALLIGEILIEAGLPPGVLNIVTSKVSIAEQMITNPEIQTIMFTGSVSTGKRIMELASQNLTNIVLELGGKDPMIVLKDADLERASCGAIWGAFMNCGQSCASIERVYVAEEIADKFIEKVLILTRKLRVGNPIEPGIEIGPMVTLSQLEVVEDHIKDATSNGAQILCGGERIKSAPGNFFEPTVLTNVNHSMKIMKEETFGPALPIMCFSEPDEALALANDCQYGLTASVWTRDKKMAKRMAERIEAGSVTVNDHMFSFVEPGAIWGGIKQTGIGRSHGDFGLLDLVNIKYVSLDFIKKKSQLWWYPYDSSLPKIIEKSITLLHHDRLAKKAKTAFSLLPYWQRIREGNSVQNIIKIANRFFKK
ncbi:MAG: aldehyde dehydrogenase family protein [Candidatus Aminicenantes bacterium]|nr:MAG: aldehyde dehydrogenase family protein [Candidatus Aminicenantes bacterium]